MKLRKCILLLPTTHNDGSEVRPDVMNRILRSIDEVFDGHTLDGICRGSYKMDDGTMSHDTSIKVWVAINPERVEELKKMAARFARLLKQESLYFEITDAEVEFVRPSHVGEAR